MLHQLVNLLTRHMSLSLDIDTTDRTTVFQCTGKYTESTALYGLGYIDQFHTETGIRLVGTETIHGFLPRHTLQRNLHVHTDGFLKYKF